MVEVEVVDATVKGGDVSAFKAKSGFRTPPLEADTEALSIVV
jgi:hypothetical protein